MRTAFLLFLLSLSANAQQATVDPRQQGFIALYKSIDEYGKHLFGCPEKPVVIDKSLCHRELATDDYRTLKAARQQAMKFFDLVERKPKQKRLHGKAN